LPAGAGLTSPNGFIQRQRNPKVENLLVLFVLFFRRGLFPATSKPPPTQGCFSRVCFAVKHAMRKNGGTLEARWVFNRGRGGQQTDFLLHEPGFGTDTRNNWARDALPQTIQNCPRIDFEYYHWAKLLLFSAFTRHAFAETCFGANVNPNIFCRQTKTSVFFGGRYFKAARGGPEAWDVSERSAGGRVGGDQAFFGEKEQFSTQAIRRGT